ncbi:FecCD family ABC transporter permease [Falsihalocynthiibacter sp. BN13B15]|uniref:FecCD family ABC transporter permease n=1 Tax=Falsihalocynthiibacter sp. BN13B15 TaxID=3240871 RepID=UPI00350F00A1
MSSHVWKIAAIAVVLLLATVGSLVTGGRSDVGVTDIFTLLTGAEDIAATTMRDIRMPRTAVAALVGVNLALAGVVLQALTRNPLASPAILGINQGAALGLVAALVFPSATGLALNSMAVAGALAAGAATFAIAGGFGGRIDPLRLVLGGVAVGAFSFAAVRFAYTLEDDLAHAVIRWTIGDIGDMRWHDAAPLAVFTLVGTQGGVALAQRLNMMALGDASARGLGADPRWTLFLGAVLAAILAGASVTVAGPIAFVGLVVPHLARVMFGGDHRVSVPAAAALGAALMLVADTLSKLIAAPSEIPVGLVAALIGAPWFLYLTLTSEALE